MFEKEKELSQWDWKELDEVIDLISGQHILSENYNESGDGLPYLTGPSDFGDYYPLVSKYTESPKAKATAGDVLLTVKGAGVGKVNILDIDEAAISRQLMALRPGPLDPKYLFYFIKSNYGHFQKLGAGSTVPGINRGQILETEVPVPPKETQTEIVKHIEEHLTKTDAGLSELESALDKLDNYWNSSVSAAFGGHLTTSLRKKECTESEKFLEEILNNRKSLWKKRYRVSRSHYKKEYSDEELEERYDLPEKPDTAELPEIPENWVWATIEHLSIVESGLTKNKAERQDNPISVPYLRVANVYADQLDLDNIKEIKVQNKELNKTLLEEGDLLIVEGNGSKDQIGRAAVWDGSISPCVHQNHLIKVRPVMKSMSQYILRWLLSQTGRKHIMKVASSTSGLYTLSLSKVRSIPIPLPPKDEMNQIMNELDRQDTIVSQIQKDVEQEMERGDRLRMSLMKHSILGNNLEHQRKGDVVSDEQNDKEHSKQITLNNVK